MSEYGRDLFTVRNMYSESRRYEVCCNVTVSNVIHVVFIVSLSLST